MHFSRRQFIRLSGLTSLGLLSDTPFTFGFSEHFQTDQNRIPVCGIRPDINSIGESGTHLRWALAPAKGIPERLTIYRRKAGSTPISSENLLCDAADWEKIAVVDNKHDVFEATDAALIFKRIPPGPPVSYNYYLPAQNNSVRTSKLSAYEKNARYYQNIIKAIRNPTTENFIVQDGYANINEVPIEKLVFKNKGNSKARINAWNLLMLGSIDPNIARMLGLYFVDRTAPAGGSYDYKIEATYENSGELICGIVQQVGNEFSGKPVLVSSLSSIQTSRTWWEFNERFTANEHYGKVRLIWQQPAENLAFNLSQRFTEPVLYALKINEEKYKLIVPLATSEKQLYFVDHRAGIPATSNYKLLGIDIFGQTSNILTSSCSLKDKDIPPAPVKLSFNTIGTSVKLLFEYGASQYLAGPDVKKFNIYQKNDSLFASKKIKYKLISLDERNEAGDRIIKIELLNFMNGGGYVKIQFIENAASKKLAASDRKSFKIHSISPLNILSFYCSIDYVPNAEGFISISQDPKSRNNGWALINSIPSRSPVIFELNDYTHFIAGSNDNSHFTGNDTLSNTGFSCKAKSILHRKYSAGIERFEDSQTPAVDDYTEIMLDRQLLQADIFTSGKVQIGASEYVIIHQSSGTAFRNINSTPGNNTRNLNKIFARILIGGNINVSVNAELKLYPALRNGNSASPNNLCGWVILRLPLNPSTSAKNGGEVLLRGIRQNIINEEISVIAEMGSDFYKKGTHTELLVFLDKEIKSLSINGPVLFFGVYELGITSQISALSLSNSEAHKSAYFAAQALDNATPPNISSLSVIAQFIKVRDKTNRPTAPPPPYPCNNENATEAFLKPPNKGGRSKFCIAWGGTTDLRYEVGRALDKTIVTAHKDMWLKGLTSIVAPALIMTSINESNAIRSSIISPVTGLIEAIATSGLSADTAPEIFVGGRFIQGARYYEIVQCRVEGGDLKLILRPMSKAGLQNNMGILVSSVTNDAFRLESMADYGLVLNDSIALRSMANQCPSAFSLVTGSTLRNTTNFLDDVPGIGSSRFFYKVRAVDASENRSAWSPASVPVWQLDTGAPDKVEPVEVKQLFNKLFLRWPSDSLHSIKRYRIYNRKDDHDLLINELFKNITGNQLPVRNLPIRINNRKLSLDFGIKFPLQISQDSSAGIAGLYKSNNNGSPDISRNYVVKQITSLSNNSIININPLLENNSEVVVVILSRRVFPLTTNKDKGTFLNVISNAVPLGYPHAINQVSGIYKLNDFDFSITPVTNQTATNYYTDSATFNAERKIVGNLQNLDENESVVVLVEGDMPVVLAGTFEPLKITGGEIILNGSFLNATSKVKGIYKRSEYNPSVFPEDQSGYNYAINEVSSVSKGMLENLLTPLSRTDTFLLEINKENGEKIIIDSYSGWNEHIIEINLAEIDPKSGFKIAAVKEIKLGGPNEVILIESEKRTL